MSNYLTVKRVKFQDIDEKGKPLGKCTFGVIAIDNYAADYNNSFDSLADLNAAIDEAGCILDLVNTDMFEIVDRDAIGKANFNGAYPYATDEGEADGDIGTP